MDPRLNLHIITGAPGTGKTAILSGLGSVGRRVREPAREMLADIPGKRSTEPTTNGR